MMYDVHHYIKDATGRRDVLCEQMTLTQLDALVGSLARRSVRMIPAEGRIVFAELYMPGGTTAAERLLIIEWTESKEGEE